MRLPDHLNPLEVLTNLIDGASTALLLIGKGRRPLHANQAFLDMSGYDYDEWMSIERTSALTPARDQQATGNSLNRAIQGEGTGFRLRPIVRKDGSELWVEARVTPLPPPGEGLLLAEFRPPYERPTEGDSWIPASD
jgi:PAS domain S-box-containing protein